MAKISIKNGQLMDQDSKAYQGLCQMLFNKELNPGQKIAYKELGVRLGVSTTPVIHALKRLEFKGIVRREPNVGYFINSLDLREIEEIFDARIALEVSLLPKTMASLDGRGVAHLASALSEHDRAVADNSRLDRVMTDLRFHMTLASLSGTKIQVSLLGRSFRPADTQVQPESVPSQHHQLIATGTLPDPGRHPGGKPGRSYRSPSQPFAQHQKAYHHGPGRTAR